MKGKARWGRLNGSRQIGVGLGLISKVSLIAIRHGKSPPTMTTVRPVEIRLGAVKRLTKELATRRADVETEKKRLDKFIAEGKDQWEVGKQVRKARPFQRTDTSFRGKSSLSRRRWFRTRRSAWRPESRS